MAHVQGVTWTGRVTKDRARPTMRTLHLHTSLMEKSIGSYFLCNDPYGD